MKYNKKSKGLPNINHNYRNRSVMGVNIDTNLFSNSGINSPSNLI
jgi:hypothetical protein